MNAGVGLRRLAHGSRRTLDADSYAPVRAATMEFRADGGRPPGIMPNLPVVPPSPAKRALALLDTETRDGGGSNVWKTTAELVVTPCAAA